MRLSDYEIILNPRRRDGRVIEDRMLLFNGLYGAADIVDPDTLKAAKAGRIDMLPEQLRERLLRRGHLTEDTDREMEDIKILSRSYRMIERSGAGLVILPTYNCSFRCSYCYERHRLSRGEEWLGHNMSLEMVDDIMKAAENMQERGIRIRDITLFGGEPFLKENRELVEYICSKAKKLNIPLVAVTNGYELEYFMDILKEYSFESLQITLDGPKEINDRRRIHRDGTGSFDKILENIALTVDNGIKVNLRVNVGPENLDSAFSIKEILEKKGLAGSDHFSFYFKATTGENYPGKDHGVSDKEVYEMLRKRGLSCFEAAEHESAYTGILNGLKSYAKKEDFFRASPVYCGAEQGMYIIDPDGIIYSCWDLLAKEELAIGAVDSGREKLALDLSMTQWRTRCVDNMPKCRVCPYIFICSGGCAGAAYAETGDFTKENCGSERDAFDELAPVIFGEAYEEKGETELTKSLKEPLDRLTAGERKTVLNSRSQREVFDIVKPFYVGGEKDRN